MKNILDFPVGTPSSQLPSHMLFAHERRVMETINIVFGDQQAFVEYVKDKDPEVWAEEIRIKYEEVTGFKFPRNIKFGE